MTVVSMSDHREGAQAQSSAVVPIGVQTRLTLGALDASRVVANQFLVPRELVMGVVVAVVRRALQHLRGTDYTVDQVLDALSQTRGAR